MPQTEPPLTPVPAPLGYQITTADPESCGLLPVIERAADGLFAGTGLLDKALASGPTSHPAGAFRTAQEAGQLWLAREPSGGPVGFVMVALPDGHFFIEQLAVHPSHARKGLGRALMATACAEAQRRHQMPVYLSTFRSVPWNAPFYARMGFTEIAPEALAPWQQRIREHEAQTLDPRQRCFMVWHGS